LGLQIIRHRVNSAAGLAKMPAHHGAEIDIRSRDSRLVLNHDPFRGGEDLDPFLRAWARLDIRGPLILNTKEDGHETAVASLLRRYKIQNYFFLDTAPATLVRLARTGRFHKAAVRVSEFEPVEAALRLKGLVGWAWLDCFSGKPAPAALVKKLARHFKVCAVSPELQGYPRSSIPKFQSIAGLLDAVCTKTPGAWEAMC
jgi:hypothetical protein